MSTATRLPTGNGSTSDWISSSGGNKWEDVDDPIGTPDDDTTYVRSGVAVGSAIDLYTFSAFSLPASTVSRVSVHRRTRESSGTSITGTAALRVNGTTYFGSNINEDGTYTARQVDWLTNPDTAAAWTAADVNGSGANPLQEFGFRGSSLGAGEELRCTQVYAETEYTESAGGNRRRRMICGAAA